MSMDYVRATDTRTSLSVDPILTIKTSNNLSPFVRTDADPLRSLGGSAVNSRTGTTSPM
jgi:hypothetical protein